MRSHKANPGLPQRLLILGVAAAASLLVAMGAAAVISYAYWGYVLGPPAVNPRVLNATKLLAHSEIDFAGQADPLQVQILPTSRLDLSMFERLRDGDGAWRLVPPSVDVVAWQADWQRRGVISADPPPSVALSRCRDAPELIKSTARLVRGVEGDGFPDRLARARVYELLGPDGEPLLFIALSTGQLSNDHRAYYELLYDDSVSPPRLLDRRHWRFDVAGMEGVEFMAIAATLVIFLLIVIMPAIAGLVACRTFSRSSRISRGRCPACAYDLRGGCEPGCPECGWGIGRERAGTPRLRSPV